MSVRFKLDYRKFPAQPTEPFPRRTSVSRPVVPIALINGSQRIRNLALIDSGADYCIFHAEIGEQIGIDIDSGKRLSFFGTGGQEQSAFLIMRKKKSNYRPLRTNLFPDKRDRV